jgi:hypothetical protein
MIFFWCGVVDDPRQRGPGDGNAILTPVCPSPSLERFQVGLVRGGYRPRVFPPPLTRSITKSSKAVISTASSAISSAISAGTSAAPPG